MTSFSFFKYFDAFELDVNVVNFVYYGKTWITRNSFAPYTRYIDICDPFDISLMAKLWKV